MKKLESYIFKEAAFRITSLGMAVSGTRGLPGGVFKNGGGNPGGKPVGGLKTGGGFGVGVEPSIPAARNLSSKEVGSTGAGVGAVAGGG